MYKPIIGKTPMIQIHYCYHQQIRYTYAKLEFYNLTGSIKDRMAYYMIQEAKKNHSLLPGQAIIEATSGNTGISFAALGAYYHHPVHIFMPDWVSKERETLMRAFGAHVHLISKKDGGFSKCIQEADLLAESINGFRPNQFKNQSNLLAHYYGTAEEIIESLSETKIKGFIAGIGSGGTIMGVGKRLKEWHPDFFVYALEPDTLPILTAGNKGIGTHKIEGIGDDFIPPIVQRSLFDDIILINDEDAIQMSQKLAQKLGLGVSISSGANFLGSVLMSQKINGDVVTVFPDDHKKYLSTELFQEKKIEINQLVKEIELISYQEIE